MRIDRKDLQGPTIFFIEDNNRNSNNSANASNNLAYTILWNWADHFSHELLTLLFYFSSVVLLCLLLRLLPRIDLCPYRDSSNRGTQLIHSTFQLIWRLLRQCWQIPVLDQVVLISFANKVCIRGICSE